MTWHDDGEDRHHDPRAAAVLKQIVLPAERVVVASHRHWASVAEPAATAVLGLVVAALLVMVVEHALQVDASLLWWLALIPVGRALYRVFEWRLEWFVATDKRLLLTSGFISRKVAMLPLGKVTDMSYTRSPMGRVLGYGRFVLESAGQDQAMRRIDWVAHPDATYRSICDTLFGGEVPVPGVTPRRSGPARRGGASSRAAERPAPVVGAGEAGYSSAPTGELPAVPPPPPPSFAPTGSAGSRAIPPAQPGPPAPVPPAPALSGDTVSPASGTPSDGGKAAPRRATGVPLEPASWPASESMPAGMLPPNLPRRGRFGDGVTRRRGRAPR
ncbi:PH domain-containing protein [Luteimicrobium sp. NPDC057192]|uniref:PH domain-containing protein n=1 Tax=Luteimicrobium sp. NPDC057192 TaxID=3346042 RepID=UPI00363DB958